MRAVLFDLDGTLLDIELEAFLGDYFDAVKGAMLPLLHDGITGDDALSALMAATRAVMSAHPGVTNKEVFHTDFRQRTGIDIDASWEVFERFYAEEFPRLRRDCTGHAGAERAVEAAKGLGLKVAVATNPIFPASAVAHRIDWAGLGTVEFDAITTYETMTACKPRPEYFRETAAMLGVAPEECLMVGDDRFLDLPAADVGMTTYYVGSQEEAQADYRGDLEGLARLLPRLTEQS